MREEVSNAVKRLWISIAVLGLTAPAVAGTATGARDRGDNPGSREIAPLQRPARQVGGTQREIVQRTGTGGAVSLLVHTESKSVDFAPRGLAGVLVVDDHSIRTSLRRQGHKKLQMDLSGTDATGHKGPNPTDLAAQDLSARDEMIYRIMAMDGAELVNGQITYPNAELSRGVLTFSPEASAETQGGNE